MAFSGLFYNIERAKNKMLKTNPNLEKCMIICQGIKKVSFLYCNVYYGNEKASCSYSLDYHFTKKKIDPNSLIVNASNALPANILNTY
jgi:hypothetical protein